MTSYNEALGLILVMGIVIIFCRALPFLFLKRLASSRIGDFVEKIVPPAAMTVLAFNSIGAPFRANPMNGLLVLAASVFTALIHLWKKNTLLSIIGGTITYMVLLNTVMK